MDYRPIFTQVKTSSPTGLRHRSLPWLIFIGGLFLLILSACQLLDAEIPFETIENDRANWTGTIYESEAPTVFAIFTPADIDIVGKFVSAKSVKTMNEMDFSKDFALAVFQGKKPTSGFSLKIDRMTKSGGAINIYVSLIEATPSFMQTISYISPYHLVKIPRGETLKGINVINVYSGQKSLATVSISPQ